MKAFYYIAAFGIATLSAIFAHQGDSSRLPEPDRPFVSIEDATPQLRAEIQNKATLPLTIWNIPQRNTRPSRLLVVRGHAISSVCYGFTAHGDPPFNFCRSSDPDPKFNDEIASRHLYEYSGKPISTVALPYDLGHDMFVAYDWVEATAKHQIRKGYCLNAADAELCDVTGQWGKDLEVQIEDGYGRMFRAAVFGACILPSKVPAADLHVNVCTFMLGLSRWSGQWNLLQGEPNVFRCCK